MSLFQLLGRDFLVSLSQALSSPHIGAQKQWWSHNISLGVGALSGQGGRSTQNLFTDKEEVG